MTAEDALYFVLNAYKTDNIPFDEPCIVSGEISLYGAVYKLLSDYVTVQKFEIPSRHLLHGDSEDPLVFDHYLCKICG